MTADRHQVERLCAELRERVGSTVDALERVVVHVAGDRYELLDTLVLRMSDGRDLQVCTDGYWPWARPVSSDPADLVILGEWDDRDRAEIARIPHEQELAPIRLDVVFAVWERQSPGREFLIGFACVEDKRTAMGIVFSGDEIEVRSMPDFWAYVDGALWGAGGVDIRRL